MLAVDCTSGIAGNICLAQGTVSFPNGVCALHAVDLWIQTGEFVTILGRNGSGKSTLLKVISGEATLTSGALWIDDRDVTRVSRHRRAHLTASVYQYPRQGLAASMTIEENCVVALLKGRKLKLRGWQDESARQQVRAAIEELELPLREKLMSPVETLSGGEQQMVRSNVLICSTPCSTSYGSRRS